MRIYFNPLQFTFDKVNYAQYGDLYVKSMKASETKFSGLKQMLRVAGVSVQGKRNIHYGLQSLTTKLTLK